MRRFQFKLQILLKHRKNIEDQKKRIFARVNRQLIEQESNLRKLENEYFDCREKVYNDPFIMRQNVYYTDKLKNDIRRQINVIKNTRTVLEQRRKEMVKASGDRRAMEIIREKRYKEFKTAAMRREQKLLDEICTQQYLAVHEN